MPLPPSTLNQLESDSHHLLVISLQHSQQAFTQLTQAHPDEEDPSVRRRTERTLAMAQRLARLALHTLRYCQQAQTATVKMTPPPEALALNDALPTTVDATVQAKPTPSVRASKSVKQAVATNEPPSVATPSTPSTPATPAATADSTSPPPMVAELSETLQGEFRRLASHREFPKNLLPPALADWVALGDTGFQQRLRLYRFLKSVVLQQGLPFL
ncbi:MAG: hypothetical protein ACKO34_06095 [Vampirovibrionales bacterium]